MKIRSSGRLDTGPPGDKKAPDRQQPPSGRDIYDPATPNRITSLNTRQEVSSRWLLRCLRILGGRFRRR
jgi:hypothetical protein